MISTLQRCTSGPVVAHSVTFVKLPIAASKLCKAEVYGMYILQRRLLQKNLPGKHLVSCAGHHSNHLFFACFCRLLSVQRHTCAVHPLMNAFHVIRRSDSFQIVEKLDRSTPACDLSLILALAESWRLLKSCSRTSFALYSVIHQTTLKSHLTNLHQDSQGGLGASFC